MKTLRFLTLIVLQFLFNQIIHAQTNNITYSQIPNAISYSGYAYNSSGVPLSLQNISLQASILKGSLTGTIEYRELHSVQTLDDGYFQITVGQGIWNSGNYTDIRDINWADDDYFLKLEIDASGGNNFGDAGTEMFCAVPYAFHSSVSDSLSGVSTDSLKIAASGICTCTLQEAYDNGSIINLNTTQNSIRINNSSVIGNSILSESTGPIAITPGYFYINSVSNSNSALVSRSLGLGNGFQVHTLNSTNASPTINTTQDGIGSALQATSGINSSNPTIISLNKGSAEAGLFRIQNATSTSSALRAEIPFVPGNPITNASAGIFNIAEPQNTSTALSVQTLGTGGAAMFQTTNNNSNNPCVDILHQSNGAEPALWVRKNSGMAQNGGAMILEQLNPTPSTGNYILAANQYGPGWGVIINKLFNASANSFNSLPALLVTNNGHHNAVQINNSLGQNNSPALSVSNIGTGQTALFTTTSTSNNSNTVEISSSSGHNGRLLFLNGNVLNNTANTFEVNSKGTGTLVRAWTNKTLGTGKYVTHLSTVNTQSSAFTLGVETNGTYGPILGVSTGVSFGSVFMSTNNSGTIAKASALYGLNFGSGNGIFGYSGANNGVSAYTNGSNSNALFASVSSSNLTTAWAGYFYGNVNVIGSYFVYGSKFGGAMVKNQNGEAKAIAAEESTEEWVSDYGTGNMQNGIVVITIEPEFSSIVNTEIPYHVFVQLEGDCGSGVKIINKTSTTFTVSEQGIAPNCNSQFSYRITAKRKGFENLRLPTEAQAKAATTTHLQSVWPNLISEGSNKNADLMIDINNSTLNANYQVISPPETPETLNPSSQPPSMPTAPVHNITPSNPTIQDENSLQSPY